MVIEWASQQPSSQRAVPYHYRHILGQSARRRRQKANRRPSARDSGPPATTPTAGVGGAVLEYKRRGDAVVVDVFACESGRHGRILRSGAYVFWDSV